MYRLDNNNENSFHRSFEERQLASDTYFSKVNFTKLKNFDNLLFVIKQAMFYVRAQQFTTLRPQVLTRI